MAITRRCRDSFITARVCEFVISILKRQEGTSHGVSFSISCTQAGWSQLSAEHQWPDAALALEPPARNPPTRQRHVWLLPPLCRFRRHPRLPGGAAPAAYQVILQCQSKQSFLKEEAYYHNAVLSLNIVHLDLFSPHTNIFLLCSPDQLTVKH